MTIEPKDLLKEVYFVEFGLLPTSGVIKPVHVANGLGRALVGRTYDSEALARMLRRRIMNQKKGVQEERNPNGMIMDQYGGAFTGRDDAVIDQDAMSTLRSLAESVLATDGAVFGQANVSSYTLSNEAMLTSDPSDVHCGRFLAKLMTAGGAGDAANHIRTLLMSDDDPWSTLAMPMLQFANVRELPTGALAGDAPALDALLSTDNSGTIFSPTLANLRASLDRLARFEQGRGSKLNSLRRLVLFSCFVTHVHLVARYSEAVEGGPRPPILLDMFDGSRISLRNASRASLRAAGDILEALVTLRLRERLAAQVAERGTDQVITDLPSSSRTLVHNAYEAFRSDEQVSEMEALSEAFWQVAVEDKHPVGFLTELGRRAGYLTPWSSMGRGGKLQKRYGINTEFLETLVAATVEPDHPLDFPEFLSELRANFGIVAGRRSDDLAVRCNNLAEVPFGTPTSVAEEDLRLNVEALRRALLEAGYAKAYADGQTVVTTNPESMAVI